MLSKGLLGQDNQPQNPRQHLSSFFHTEGNQSRQSKQYPIPRQEFPSQRIKDKVEMDTEDAHTLQAEEQAREQCCSFQIDRHANYSAKAQDRKKQTTSIIRTS